jgi:hypothetical protein
MALSPAIPVMDSPVFQHLTRPHTRHKHTYGPKAAVSYKNPRFPWGSRHRGLDVSIRRSGNAVAVQRSNLNVVCKTKSKTLLELSTDRGKRPYSLIRRSGNAVAVQRSNLNVVCKTKSKTLLELSTDRGKRPYSHCTVTTTPNNDGRPENVMC